MEATTLPTEPQPLSNRLAKFVVPTYLHACLPMATEFLLLQIDVKNGYLLPSNVSLFECGQLASKLSGLNFDDKNSRLRDQLGD